MKRTALIVAVAGLVASPATLEAHTRLERSQPAAGSTLTQSPRFIRLVFSEAPELALTSIRLESIAGQRIAIGPLTRDPANIHAVEAGVISALAPGRYRVAWLVASRDGHPVRGVIEFSIVPASASETMSVVPGQAVPTDPRADAATEETIMSAQSDIDEPPMAIGGALGFIVARWLSFISLFVVIGVVVFRFVVLRRASPNNDDAFTQVASTNAATMGMVASLGVIISALLKLARESADMRDIAFSALLFGSTWGWSLLLQLAAAAAAAVAFRGVHRPGEPKRRGAWRIALVSVTALAVTPSLAGHAIADNLAIVAVPIDLIHFVAGAAWLGTLAVVVIVGISATLKTPDATRPGARTATLVNAFSPLALMCGAMVIATGLISSVLQLPRVDALWTTPYGAALVLKLFFVTMLFGAGAWNWRRMKPRLTGDDAIVPLRSMASLELLLGTVVLGITAVLVALELP